MNREELIEIGDGIFVSEDKIKCEIGVQDYFRCDKFRKNSRGCINCDCVIIDGEDKITTQTMADKVYKLEETNKELEKEDRNTKQLLREMCAAVVENKYDQYIPEEDWIDSCCNFCGNFKTHKHDKDCVSIKAQKWIEDNKE